ncbi:hypothetical protein Deiofobo_0270 [Pseudomonas phage Deifobo]|nr:hypothetical protein Deiofobo_0270 [Pseudomonas phage Deifobo]
MNEEYDILYLSNNTMQITFHFSVYCFYDKTRSIIYCQ